MSKQPKALLSVIIVMIASLFAASFVQVASAATPVNGKVMISSVLGEKSSQFTARTLEEFCAPKPDPAPPASGPVANNDCFRYYPGVTVYPNVMLNDVSPAGSNTKVCGYRQPASSDIVVGPKLGLSLVIKKRAKGSYEFPYAICDSDGLYDLAVVTVRITPVTYIKPVKVKSSTNRQRFKVVNRNKDTVFFSWQSDVGSVVDQKYLQPGQSKVLKVRGGKVKKVRWFATIGEFDAFAGRGTLKYG